MSDTVVGLLQLALDLVDLRLQLVVVETVRDGVRGKIEEGNVYRRNVVLMLRDPCGSDYAIGEGGRAWREWRYGRVQNPRCRCCNSGTVRRCRLGVCGRVRLFGGQLEGLASISPWFGGGVCVQPVVLFLHSVS